MSNLQIVGTAQLKAKFAKLAKSVQGQVLVNATKPGARLVLDRAKELAPRDTGQLAERGLQIRVTRRRKTYGETSVTNTKAGAHAVLQEYGVRPHLIGKKKHPGHKPQPFMRPAFDQKKNDAAAEVGHELRRLIFEAAR